MHLFYTPNISIPEYTLNEEESKHCVRVLRLSIGDKIVLIDGKGGWYEGEIIFDHPKKCGVKIVSKQQEVGKRAYQLHIAIAPTKNMDRLEWFAEKATEIGIDSISLLHCQNSERDVVKTERLEKVLISAMKQSMNAYLPQLSAMTDFKKYITTSKAFAGKKFIAHCYDTVSNTNKLHLKQVYPSKENALILIGPEGDFSMEEVRFAIENGFQEISLGASRLRTETAALAACLTVHIINS